MAPVNLEKPLMPKATAVWLIDNTALTFEQIADFCGLDSLEVQALADEEVGRGIVGRNPIDSKELTLSEIERCQNDGEARLAMRKRNLPPVKSRSKGPRYTPVAKRGDKPDAIAYLVKNHQEIPDSKICKLVGTTKPTIESIRNKTHASMQSIKPRHPADLGLCTYVELQEASDKGFKAQGKDPQKIKEEKEAEANALAQENDANDPMSGGFDFSNFLGTSDNSDTPKENQE